VTPTRNWILFSALRIGLFAVILTILLLLGIEPWIAAVIAAVIGLCVSYIFFRPQREALAESVSAYRSADHRDEDADAESDDDLGTEEPGHPDAGGPERGRGSERDGGAEAHSEEQSGPAGELQREDELGGGAPREGDDRRR
jgi:hypothetical protein